MKKVIDVSFYQKTIDWEKVKSQIDGAILRVGYGGNQKNQDDKQFIRNANECTRLGIPFGVYIYSYANTIEKAKSEAGHVLRLIKGYKLSYPVYLDLEDRKTMTCSKKMIGDMAEVFCKKIKETGYYPAIYANKYWFESILTDSRFNNWDRWVAQYSSKCTYKGKYSMWQYSSKGIVNGISGNVDMNYCYVDYPSIINGRTQVLVNIPDEEVQNQFKPYKVKINVSSVLNVRKGASTSYPIAAKLKNGEVYTIVDEKNGWGKLKSGVGWICLKYTKKC